MTAAPKSDIDRLRALPGLGKASVDCLVEVGIASPEALRQIGAEDAWRRLRFAHGARITITWIYALDTAIRGISWKDLSKTRARQLRAAAEAIIGETGPALRPTKRSRKSSRRV